MTLEAMETVKIENPDAVSRTLEIGEKSYELQTLTTEQAFEFADIIFGALTSSPDPANPDMAAMLSYLTSKQIRKKTMELIEKSSGIKSDILSKWSLKVFVKIVRYMVEDNIDFLSQETKADLEVLESKIEFLDKNSSTS